MASTEIGDTMKLVGAMMRLRHNTNFKGGLDLGGAPSSIASAAQHLDFLRLFSSQLRREKQEGGGSTEHEAADDGGMLAAKFAEIQIRALVYCELEACLTLHESENFWRQRLERRWAYARNWLEMGPWTWGGIGPADCGDVYLERLECCKRLLRVSILRAGSLQLHLTQMKQAYMDGTLKTWNREALEIIRQAVHAMEASESSASTDRDRRRSTSPEFPRGLASYRGLFRRTWFFLSKRLRHAALSSSGRRDSVTSEGDSALGDDGVGPAYARSDEQARTLAYLREHPDQGIVRADEPVDWAMNAPEHKSVVEQLMDTSSRLIAVSEAHEKGEILLLPQACTPPSRIRRNWVAVAMATPVTLAALVHLYKSRGVMRKSLLMVRASLRQFVREHISEPFWGIYNELVHNQPLTMTDANALGDSNQSLQRMLQAFIKDTKPDLSAEEVRNMAATGDMSVVSREYEKSIINAWKNFVAGDIVRMMLIQVQFIKRELLIATSAIGQLTRENELNLRLMATVPAFLLAWGFYRAVRPAYYILKSEKSREAVFRDMRYTVLAMERLLTLRHREGTLLQLTSDVPTVAPRRDERSISRRGSLFAPGHVDQCTRQVMLPAGLSDTEGVMAVTVLDELDLGKLMLLVHEFQRLVRFGRRRFHRVDLVNCKEDLAELVGERGLVSVGQQLAIVQRMQRSYRFLALRD